MEERDGFRFSYNRSMTSLANIDLEDALSRLGIDFRRRGRELFACCPFHEERTPSWSIRSDGSDRHAMWRCKGSCAEPDDRGSIITLVARVLDLRRDDGELDRRAAWKWLGFGDDDRPVEPPALAIELVVSDDAPVRFELPAGVVVAPSSEWSTLPLRYLVRERGVSPEQIDRWGLGYATSGRLAGRVVLPVRDASGAPRSYSARSFLGDRLTWKSADRSERPDVSAIFGERFWPAAERGTIVVVEAALDALACEAATDRHRSVGAIHGSELLPEHARKLATFPEILVATDPDEAGEKIHDAIRQALARWTRIRRVRMPAGLDASKLWREDPDALRRVLAP